MVLEPLKVVQISKMRIAVPSTPFPEGYAVYTACSITKLVPYTLLKP